MMKRVSIFLFFLLTAYCLLPVVSIAADTPSNPKIPVTPEAVEKGKVIYFKRCSFCHGLLGNGEGPAADQMMPRPRDFTMGLYKFRSTESGALPTDEDIFRVISRGIPGTAMQTFDSGKIKNGLTEEERWQVIYYIKTFSDSFEDKDNDPYQMVVKVSEKVESSPESIAKGEKIFKEMKCWECHGEGGRGTGPNAAKLKDKFKGDPILPFDLTKGWRYKAGNASEDISKRFSSGLNGTPMPSFIDSLNDEERWHLANYVVSLQKKELKAESVLKAKLVNGELPSAPDDPAWQKVEGIDVQMAGQVIAKPRWENPSVDVVSVKAIYNDKEIAFLLEWSDRFKDRVHNQEAEYPAPAEYDGYVKWSEIQRNQDTFRDSIAVQFPVKIPEGTKKPHFFRGDGSNPVNLWVWKSDLEEAGQPSVEDVNAAGYKQPMQVQAPEGQNVKGKGVWKDGVWSVVMKRPLLTGDKNDIQFDKGKFIPLVFNAWDGSNGEHGLLMSISSGNYLVLESSVPASVYLYAFLGIIGAGGVEWWLMRKVGGRKQEQEISRRVF